MNNSLVIPSSSQANPLLRRIALVGWSLIVAANALFFAFDLASDYADMLVPCTGVLGYGGPCNFLAVSAAEEAVLASWGLTLHFYATAMNIAAVILLVVYGTLSALILWRQGPSRIGLIVSLALIALPIATVSGDNDWSGAAPLFFFLTLVVAISGTAIEVCFLYLIPNGRFSPKWAYFPLICTLVLLSVLLLNVNGVIFLSAPGRYWLQVVLVGLVLLGGALQVYRYLRESNPVERQQTKWIIFGVLAYIFSVIIWILIFANALTIPSGRPRLLANLGGWYFINTFTLLILPVAMTIAIQRYRLWNIDLIINRALVYGGLTLGVVFIYVLTVVGLGFLFQSSGNLVISLLATGLIAVAFNPLRQRLQRMVNRLIYGQRDEPYTVLSHLSRQLQTAAVPGETLRSIVETIAGTLKLPYVAIELLEQDAQIGQAAVGEPVSATIELPLRYQQESVGRLVVSPRAYGEIFTPQEQQLLADIAAQTGPVASATRLTLALQRSREQLVLAREEERRRIRRDLHDGLGPTLASQTLKLDAVLELLNGESGAAAEHLCRLKSQTQQMVVDIRRLVYELRPPALDELGLLEALRAHVAQMDESNSRLRIAVEAAPEPLPALPAAVEVAAYRIALEAVTNVIRHAQARDCRVRIEIAAQQQPALLRLTVTDDGVGLPENLQPGVGLISMRERAAELGGTCTFEAMANGGVQIRAALPFIIAA